MATWSTEELRKIAEADDLHISPFREDGVTYGTPTWIWSVAVGPRALRARLQRPEISLVSGRDAAEGGADHCRRHEKGSQFESVDGPINDLVDDAYRAKYHGSPYLSSMLGARARSATVKVMPRDTGA